MKNKISTISKRWWISSRFWNLYKLSEREVPTEEELVVAIAKKQKRKQNQILTTIKEEQQLIPYDYAQFNDGEQKINDQNALIFKTICYSSSVHGYLHNLVYYLTILTRSVQNENLLFENIKEAWS